MDTILAHLRQKAPGDYNDLRERQDKNPREQEDAASTHTVSVKSELARGLQEIKGRIQGLDERIANKKKSLAGATGTASSNPTSLSRRREQRTVGRHVA